MSNKKSDQEEMQDQSAEEVNVENTAEAKGEETKEAEKKSEEDAEEVDELTLMKKNYEEINDKYLRLYSEFDNFRKRTQKEKLELYKTAGEDILISLLPVLDDFERAQKALKESEDAEAFKTGIELIRQKFNNTLTQKGLRPMDSAIGKEFDTNFQDAITRVPAPEKGMKGKVIDEVEKGYMLYDKVIRYAKVVVGE